MPRNSSGVYTLPLPPVVPGTTITSTWANTTLDDVTAGLTDSLDRYGRGGMVAPFRLIDGTEALPAFAFNAETGSGLFRASTGVVGLSVLGTARQEWTSAGVAVLADFAVTGGIDVSGGMTVHGLFEVVGAVAFDSNVGIGGNLGVVGTSTFTGNVAMSNQLVVGGPVLFTNTLDVNGATTLGALSAATLSVAGASSFTGTASFAGNVNVGGAFTIAGQPLSSTYLPLAGGVMSGDIDMRSPYPGAGGTPASHSYGFSAVQSFGSVVAQAGMNVAYTRVSGDTDYGSDLYFTTSLDNAPIERMRIDRQGWVGIGGTALIPGLSVRDDVNGGFVSLRNLSVSGATHTFGAVLFDAFRDVLNPSHVAAMWAAGTSPAGNTVDLIFGTQVNAGSGLPTERMRIAGNGTVGINTLAAPQGALEVVGGGVTTLLRQTNPASYTSLRLYNDLNNPFRALEIDYTGSTYSGGEGANIAVTGAFPLQLSTNNSPVLTIPGLSPYFMIDNVRNQRLGWANLPQSSPGDFQIGMVTYLSANVNYIGGGAAVGTTYIMFNNTAGNLTFFEVGGLNVWLGGTNGHGNRTIASHSLATLWYWDANNAVMCGQGVS